jgi:hypothetical protein
MAQERWIFWLACLGASAIAILPQKMISQFIPLKPQITYSMGLSLVLIGVCLYWAIVFPLRLGLSADPNGAT